MFCLTSLRSADSSKCAMSSVRRQETKVCREVSKDWLQDNVEEHLHGKVKTHADCSIKESVENRPLSVSTDMFASDVERRDMPRRSAQAKRLEWYRVRGERLKCTRKYLWKVSDEELGLTTWYSLTTKPLPRPSPMVESDPVRQATTSNHPDLFKIICKIDVNTFEWLLTHHPNWGFIDSVIVGLHEGFWPFADMMKEGYPKSWDGSWHLLKSEKERDFLEEQVWTEIAAEHFLELFGIELLLGMYSPPVHAVPKPDSDMMRLVVDHSIGDFSPNSIIVWEDVMGVWLDRLHTLGVSIMWSKHNCPSADLILYKSDVSAIYCQLLMHPLYHILQIVTMGSQRYVDRSNNFGGRVSQIIWQSFMSLVIWILVFRRRIGTLKCYINGAFSVARAEDVCWYEPYCWAIPVDQAKILHLWDKTHLPHTEKTSHWKGSDHTQIWGRH